MSKKWRACVFSVMALGGVVIGTINQPSLAAPYETTHQVIMRETEQEQRGNKREINNGAGRVNFFYEVKLPQRQKTEIALQQEKGE